MTYEDIKVGQWYRRYKYPGYCKVLDYLDRSLDVYWHPMGIETYESMSIFIKEFEPVSNKENKMLNVSQIK